VGLHASVSHSDHEGPTLILAPFQQRRYRFSRTPKHVRSAFVFAFFLLRSTCRPFAVAEGSGAALVKGAALVA
jgi:hypothetical protein